jgi:transcriptional regulator with XRE-family HTH domain
VSDWQERLDEAMAARSLSGAELARRTGLTSQYVNSLRSKERGARLTLETARRLATALGVSVDWLTKGTGPRERLSDVYPVYAEPAPDTPLVDKYPTRRETIALIAPYAGPEVIAALRAVVPDDPEVDPGRDFWIGYAKSLARDLRRIQSDPDLGGRTRTEIRAKKR